MVPTVPFAFSDSTQNLLKNGTKYVSIAICFTPFNKMTPLVRSCY